MSTIVQGYIDGKGKKFALVASRFNELITSKLIDGAHDCLVRHHVKDDDITVIWVPGAFEIPSIAKRCVGSKKYDGIICLGAVIRGGTPHFDYVASEVTKGVALIGLESEIPVVFGVLTTDTIEQAIERAGTKAGNKGFDAALSLLEMADLMGKI